MREERPHLRGHEEVEVKLVYPEESKEVSD